MKSFLICHRGALGDFVLTWPAIYCLRKALPNHQFLGIGRPEYMRLAISFGLFDTYIDNESADLLGFFSGERIPEQIGFPQGAIMWLTNGKEVVNLFRDSAVLPVVSVTPFPDIQMHLAQYYCSAIKSHFPITIPENLSDCFPDIATDRQYTLIHPGSGSLKKNYNPCFYLTLADELRRSGYHNISFIFGPAEDEKMNQKDFDGERIERPKNIEALARLLTGATLYIGNDSGVSHLSGFVGTQTVTLYKTTDPKIWGVIGKRIAHISAINEKLASSKIQKYLTNLISDD